MGKRTAGAALAALLALGASGAIAQTPPPADGTHPIRIETAHGRTLFAETQFAFVAEDAPLILLFHQGGSNGRGEYLPIMLALNFAGYRTMAWDLSAGGDTYGAENRTVAVLRPGQAPEGFCDVYPDLQAALDHVIETGLAERAVVWGSSYSGSLVFRLAAENPKRVAGVAAFSPASGGPMTDCRAGLWAGEISAPVLVMRPASEMASESALAQQETLVDAGAQFHIVENGVHGSSMLVDDRTGHDMRAARAIVLDWLADVTAE